MVVNLRHLYLVIIMSILLCQDNSGSLEKSISCRGVQRFAEYSIGFRGDDLLPCLSSWHTVTLDGYRWSTSAPGYEFSGSAQQNLVIDNHHIEIGFPHWSHINQIPVFSLNAIAIKPSISRSAVGGRLHPSGFLDLLTSQRSLFHAGILLGNPTGDPGPLRYTNPHLDNVDRVAMDPAIHIQARLKDNLINAGIQETYFPTTRSKRDQYLQDYPWDWRRLYQLSPALRWRNRSTEWEVDFLVLATFTGKIPGTGKTGMDLVWQADSNRYMPVQTHSWTASAVMTRPFSTSTLIRFYGQVSQQELITPTEFWPLLDLRRETARLGAEWIFKTKGIQSSLGTTWRQIKMTANHISTSIIEQPYSIWGSLTLNNGQVFVDGGLERLSFDTVYQISARFRPLRRIPFSLLVARFYTNGEVEPNQVTGEWDIIARQNSYNLTRIAFEHKLNTAVRITTTGYVHYLDDLYTAGDGIVFPSLGDTHGSTAGIILHLLKQWSSKGIEFSVLAQTRQSLSGDGSWQDFYRQIPKINFEGTLLYSPWPDLTFRFKTYWRSPTRWSMTDARSVSHHFDPILDVTMAKTMLNNKCISTVKIINVTNGHCQYHPAGENQPLTVMVGLELEIH